MLVIFWGALNDAYPMSDTDMHYTWDLSERQMIWIIVRPSDIYQHSQLRWVSMVALVFLGNSCKHIGNPPFGHTGLGRKWWTWWLVMPCTTSWSTRVGKTRARCVSKSGHYLSASSVEPTTPRVPCGTSRRFRQNICNMLKSSRVYAGSCIMWQLLS